MEFTTRAYNSFEINPKTKASIIKTSEEERLRNEYLYYLNLPKDLQVYFPRLIDYESTPPYKMELEYYAYNNLGNQMVSSEYDEDFWSKVFDFLLRYIDTYKNSMSKDGDSTDVLFMTANKTENEYAKLFDGFEFFSNLKDEKEYILNGKVLKPFNEIWDKIKKYIESDLIVDKFYYIHGDLCFSNILYGVNPITQDLILKMIDPRGSFGNTKYFGDPYYDLAKVSHSCSGGYEYFIYDKFNVDVDKNSFNLTFSSGNVKDSINDKFINLVNRYGFNYETIKLIEGCIYVGMCARHYDSLERQKAMYITGLNILNEIYETI